MNSQHFSLKEIIEMTEAKVLALQAKHDKIEIENEELIKKISYLESELESRLRADSLIKFIKVEEAKVLPTAALEQESGIANKLIHFLDLVQSVKKLEKELYVLLGGGDSAKEILSRLKQKAKTDDFSCSTEEIEKQHAIVIRRPLENRNLPHAKEFLRAEYKGIRLSDSIEICLNNSSTEMSYDDVTSALYQVNSKSEFFRAKGSIAGQLRMGATEGRWVRTRKGFFACHEVAAYLHE